MTPDEFTVAEKLAASADTTHGGARRTAPSPIAFAFLWQHHGHCPP